MVRQHSILIIEDNEINREIIYEILKNDYTLLFAGNGKQGLEILQEKCDDISVIMLDIEMPVMNGYEFMQQVKLNPVLKDIPIIVSTSINDPNEEVKCLQMGACDFTRKPYDPVLVRLRVDSVIRLSESTEANRQKALFIHHMSHEIRTPMNAILGFSQLLKDFPDKIERDELVSYTSNIFSNSMVLISMIDNMLALSNINSRQDTIKKTDFNINKVCLNTIKNPQFNNPNNLPLQFSSDLPDGYIINSDPLLLELILRRLLANACKFANKGSVSLHCAMAKEPGCIAIQVTDNGCGIASDKAETIFDKFYKIDDFSVGLGIGLSIARIYACYLDSKLYLDTTHTDGTRFVLQMPITTSDNN